MMSIVNTICEAIYAELIRIETNLHKEGRKEIKRILVDFPTAMDIRRDGHLYYWGNEYIDECDGGQRIHMAIMNYPIVPTDQVTGFELMLNDGTLAPKAAKGTAQN